MSSSVVSGISTATSSTLVRMNPIASRKAKKEITNRRADVKTYTVPIIFAREEARKSWLRSYYKKVANSKKTALYRLRIMVKYPSTVGKFYHELVERSGKVTSEDFWQRYDYRCCNVNMVLRELQVSKEIAKAKEEQKMKVDAATSKKHGCHFEESSGVQKSSGKMSWMKQPSSSSSTRSQGIKNRSEVATSIPRGGIDATATDDTVDEEQYEDLSVDHVEKFKRSLSGSETATSVSETTVESTPDRSKTKETQVSSACRSHEATTIEATSSITTTFNDERVDRQAFQVYMSLGVLLISVLVASLTQSPTLWTSREFASRMCSPIQPGKVLNANDLYAQKKESVLFVAPWWAPISMKDSAFYYLCAKDAEGNYRNQTQAKVEMHSKSIPGKEDIKLMTVTMNRVKCGVDCALLRIHSVKSVAVDADGKVVRTTTCNGETKEFDAPWVSP